MNRHTPLRPNEADRGHVIERPDGFYWQDNADGKVYGPFRTLLDAMLDMRNEDEEGEFEEGESLEEAESEIGITGWIDPDTGMPAEETTPRFTDE
ncbi:MAG TPA: hypothetical protein VIU46_08725 [Gallionellaceae bacterium]